MPWCNQCGNHLIDSGFDEEDEDEFVLCQGCYSGMREELDDEYEEED